MDHSNINTELSKNKHLIFLERMTIELRLKYGFSAYKISKELGRSINTILIEIRRGTTIQIRQDTNECHNGLIRHFYQRENVYRTIHVMILLLRIINLSFYQHN